jgi:hypothetical protein
MSEIRTRKVVDEDWKARIQREKEEARLKAEGVSAPKPGVAPSQPVAPSTPEVAPATQEADAPTGEVNPLFEGLVNMMATQTMYCLGLLGGQGPGPVTVNLEQAKEAIDIVVMLRDKTQGNLNTDEAAILRETIAELQRLFAARVQQAQAQAMQQAGIDPANLRGRPQ